MVSFPRNLNRSDLSNDNFNIHKSLEIKKNQVVAYFFSKKT